MLRAGTLSVTHARQIATLPAEAQAPVLALIRTGDLVTEDEVILAVRVAREAIPAA